MGNPLKSEVAAFRWLIAVVIGAISVILVTEVISSAAGLIWGMVLISVVAVIAIRGMVYMLGSPDNDEEPRPPEENDA